jgi:hypothetical protein
MSIGALLRSDFLFEKSHSGATMTQRAVAIFPAEGLEVCILVCVVGRTRGGTGRARNIILGGAVLTLRQTGTGYAESSQGWRSLSRAVAVNDLCWKVARGS